MTTTIPKVTPRVLSKRARRYMMVKDILDRLLALILLLLQALQRGFHKTSEMSHGYPHWTVSVACLLSSQQPEYYPASRRKAGGNKKGGLP